MRDAQVGTRDGDGCAAVQDAAADCVFCSTECEQPDHYVPVDRDVAPTLLIATTERHRVLSDNAPLAPGHALVVPHRHVTSLAWLDPDELADLAALLGRLRTAMRDLFAVEPVLFEHGVVGDDASSCCLTHAHLHVVPVALGPGSRLASIDAPTLTAVETLDDLRTGRGRDYLYVHVPPGPGRAIDASELPSQIGRQLAADGSATPVWNWRDRLLLADPVTLARDVERGAAPLRETLAAAMAPGI